MLVELMVVRGTSHGAELRRRVALLALLSVALVCFAFSGSAVASSAPTIESVSVSGITEHDATLEAQISTQGGYTGYWFQIDTNGSYDFTQADCPFELPGYAECDSITDGEPLPAGLVEPQPAYIPAGSGDRSVSLDLASIGATLQPGTTYHYRVLASSGGAPMVTGPDQTFGTPSQSLSQPTGGSTGTLPGAIEPLPVNEQIEREFEEHPPWDRVPSSPSGEAPTAVVAKGGVLPKAKALTTAQKLAEALKACKRKPKRKQANCRKQAEKKYATAATKTS
jgi:hypothetical protein